MDSLKDSVNLQSKLSGRYLHAVLTSHSGRSQPGISPQMQRGTKGEDTYTYLTVRRYIALTLAEDLAAYLNERLTDSDWLEYLDRLWHREKAPPMIITSVWAARSFACATYTVHPPNTSAFAQISTSAKGDKMCWTQESEGFETACAPLDYGYDENDKLRSQVEDQCFAVEGFVLKSRKEVSKLRASLVTI